MKGLTSILNSLIQKLPADMRVRLGLGAGASVLLSAGVLGMGGTLMPSFLHASSTPPSIIPIERLERHATQELEVIDMSTTTVSQIIESLPKAQRFELMLYNSGAGNTLKARGSYTVFVPESSRFDYLPKRFIAGLTRAQTRELSLNHIVSRALPIEESLSGNVITLGNTVVSFSVDAGANTISVGGAKVTKAYKASNGMVYLIDRVLATPTN